MHRPRTHIITDDSGSKEMQKIRLSSLHLFPFFGNISLKLNLIPDTIKTKTMATDGDSIWFNPKFVKTQTKKELMFIFLHEICHVINLHHVRYKPHMDYKIWQIAADYVTNAMLKDIPNLPMPEDALYCKKYENASVEFVYKDIMRIMNEDQPGEQDSDTKGEENSDQKSQKEYPKAIEELYEKTEKFGSVELNRGKDVQEEQKQMDIDLCLTKRLLDKNKQIDQSKKIIPQKLREHINTISDSKASWKQILSHFLMNAARDDWNWMKPDIRMNETKFIFPSIHSEAMVEFVIAIDTSGSINKEKLNKFIAETKKILTDIEYRKVHIIYCSDKITGYQVFSKQEKINLIETNSGGTSFLPVWDLIENKNITCTCLLYFTDLRISYYHLGKAQPFPILWCLFEDNPYMKPDFGEMVYIK